MDKFVLRHSTKTQSPAGGPDYDYLLGMKMWNLTEEKKNELLKQRDNKQQELKRLQAKTKEQMWEEDLTALMEKLDEVEAKEREEDEAEVGPNAKKGGGCTNIVGSCSGGQRDASELMLWVGFSNVKLDLHLACPKHGSSFRQRFFSLRRSDLNSV